MLFLISMMKDSKDWIKSSTRPKVLKSLNELNHDNGEHVTLFNIYISWRAAFNANTAERFPEQARNTYPLLRANGTRKTTSMETIPTHFQSSPYVADYLQSMSISGNACDAEDTLAEMWKSFQPNFYGIEEAADNWNFVAAAGWNFQGHANTITQRISKCIWNSGDDATKTSRQGGSLIILAIFSFCFYYRISQDITSYSAQLKLYSHTIRDLSHLPDDEDPSPDSERAYTILNDKKQKIIFADEVHGHFGVSAVKLRLFYMKIA